MAAIAVLTPPSTTGSFDISVSATRDPVSGSVAFSSSILDEEEGEEEKEETSYYLPHSSFLPLSTATTSNSKLQPQLSVFSHITKPNSIRRSITAGATTISGNSPHIDKDFTNSTGAREQQPNIGSTMEAINALLDPKAANSLPAAPLATVIVSEPLAKIAKILTTTTTTQSGGAATIPAHVSAAVAPTTEATTPRLQTDPAILALSSYGTTDTPTATAATVTDVGSSIPLLRSDNFGRVHQRESPPIAPELIASQQCSSPTDRSYTYPGTALLTAAPQHSAQQQQQHQHNRRIPTRGGSLPTPDFSQSSPKSPSSKRYKCPYCSTDFTRHHNLKSHLLTHSQEKPYECPTCHARFRRLHDLKRHTKLHTGERPHTCHKCGRRFARGDALARHNKGQSGCAGRRSSFGGDEEDFEGREAGDEEHMQGLVYHSGGGEEIRIGDEFDDHLRDKHDRSLSESSCKLQALSRDQSGPNQYPAPPGTSGSSSVGVDGATGSSSSYPPLGPRFDGSSPRGLYSLSSSQALPSPRDSSMGGMGGSGSSGGGHLNSGSSLRDSAPSSLPSATFGQGAAAAAAAAIFAQGGMTESPKPISPGHTDAQPRLGVADMTGRQGLQQHLSQNRIDKGNQNQRSASFGLPPLGGSSANATSPTQPPGLRGRASESRAPLLPNFLGQQSGASSGNGKGGTHELVGPSGSSNPFQRTGGSGPVSNPGSTSSNHSHSHSHGQSSGSSIRDNDMWGAVRDLKSQITNMRDEHEVRVQNMQEEITSLRRQLAEDEQPRQQRQQQQASPTLPTIQQAQ